MLFILSKIVIFILIFFLVRFFIIKILGKVLANKLEQSEKFNSEKEGKK